MHWVVDAELKLELQDGCLLAVHARVAAVSPAVLPEGWPAPSKQLTAGMQVQKAAASAAMLVS